MIIFRKARPGDFKVIKSILEEVKLMTEGIEQHLDNFMVAEERGTILATGGLEIYDDVAILRSVAVLPEFRHQRIGDGLVRALINYAERRGIKNIFLFTKDAVPFFEKIGFQVVDLKELDEKCTSSLQVNTCSKSAILMKLNVKDFFHNIKCRK